MVTLFNILAWRIPWTEEPGMLQSSGSQENQTQLSDWVYTNARTVRVRPCADRQECSDENSLPSRNLGSREKHNYNKSGFQIPSIGSVQFSSVAQSCPTLCDPMNRRMPGLPVHHQLLEFTQTHVHWVGDAIQPSHPLSSPSPPAPNPFQHQGLFQWVNSSHEVAKGLEFQLQHQSFQWTPRTYLLQDGLVGSPCSPRDSQESSPTPQCKSINSSVLSFLHSPTLTSIHDYWKNHSLY